MFVLYNAVMRKFPKHIMEHLDGNTFTTTIHCINSAIIKLSRACPLRPRFVVRGSKGMRLPQKFAIKDKLGNQVCASFILLTLVDRCGKSGSRSSGFPAKQNC